MLIVNEILMGVGKGYSNRAVVYDNTKYKKFVLTEC